METMIIDKKTLPSFISSHIHSDKIKLFERNGSIILSPLDGNKYSILEESFGLFSDGKLSSERFMAEKMQEKETEK